MLLVAIQIAFHLGGLEAFGAWGGILPGWGEKQTPCPNGCQCFMNSVECRYLAEPLVTIPDPLPYINPFHPDEELFKLLYLTGNNITSMMITTPNDVKDMKLDDNKIAIVKETGLENFPELEWLNLNQNLLTSFDSKTYATLTVLTNLWLERNAIEVAEFGEMPPSLLMIWLGENNIKSLIFGPAFNKNQNIEIYLDGNPLHCDCNFVATLMSFNSSIVKMSGECETPPEMLGVSIANMTSVHMNATCSVEPVGLKPNNDIQELKENSSPSLAEPRLLILIMVSSFSFKMSV